MRRWAKALKVGKRQGGPARLLRVEVVAPEPSERPVVVNVAGRRVEVLNGFSKSTLAAVLDVVERRR